MVPFLPSTPDNEACDYIRMAASNGSRYDRAVWRLLKDSGYIHVSGGGGVFQQDPKLYLYFLAVSTDSGIWYVGPTMGGTSFAARSGQTTLSVSPVGSSEWQDVVNVNGQGALKPVDIVIGCVPQPPIVANVSAPGANVSATAGCANSCYFGSDGECDDGGLGTEYASCIFATDCEDCGARTLPPPPLPPVDPPPWDPPPLPPWDPPSPSPPLPPLDPKVDHPTLSKEAMVGMIGGGVVLLPVVAVCGFAQYRRLKKEHERMQTVSKVTL